MNVEPWQIENAIRFSARGDGELLLISTEMFGAMAREIMHIRALERLRDRINGTLPERVEIGWDYGRIEETATPDGGKSAQGSAYDVDLRDTWEKLCCAVCEGV